MKNVRFASVFILSFALLGQSFPVFAGSSTGPDINVDGVSDMGDVTCIASIIAAQVRGSDKLPSCAVDYAEADVDCSGEISVVDQILAAYQVNGATLSLEIDSEQDGVVDSCQIKKNAPLVSPLAPAPQTTLPKATKVVQGPEHACVLLDNGKIDCWASGLYGSTTQGNDGFFYQKPPIEATFTDVAVGDGYSCGIKADSSIYCWGSEQVSTLLKNPKGKGFSMIVSAEDRLCGLKKDATYVCWGNTNTYAGWNKKSYVSMSPNELFSQISLSSNGLSFCGVRLNGSVVCSGYDASKEDVAYWSGSESIQPPANETFKSVSADWPLNCGVRMDDSVYCWGGKQATAARKYAPSGYDVKEVFTSGDLCALRMNGEVVCWNYNEPAQPVSNNLYTHFSLRYDGEKLGVLEDGTIDNLECQLPMEDAKKDYSDLILQCNMPDAYWPAEKK